MNSTSRRYKKLAERQSVIIGRLITHGDRLSNAIVCNDRGIYDLINLVKDWNTAQREAWDYRLHC